MKDLKERAKFWGTREDGGYGVDCSEARPFDKHIDIFRGKSALEIGPGSGRQYEVLSKLALVYDVADISQAVLDKPVFAAANRLLISNYDGLWVPTTYDVLTFWYVLHHVREDELTDFVDFVAKFTCSKGYAYFNTLEPSQYHVDDLKGDGLTTTPHSFKSVCDAFGRHFELLDVQFISYNCIPMLWRRK